MHDLTAALQELASTCTEEQPYVGPIHKQTAEDVALVEQAAWGLSPAHCGLGQVPQRLWRVSPVEQGAAVRETWLAHTPRDGDKDNRLLFHPLPSPSCVELLPPLPGVDVLSGACAGAREVAGVRLISLRQITVCSLTARARAVRKVQAQRRAWLAAAVAIWRKHVLVDEGDGGMRSQHAAARRSVTRTRRIFQKPLQAAVHAGALLKVRRAFQHPPQTVPEPSRISAAAAQPGYVPR
jgi:hypothetical protein